MLEWPSLSASLLAIRNHTVDVWPALTNRYLSLETSRYWNILDANYSLNLFFYV